MTSFSPLLAHFRGPRRRCPAPLNGIDAGYFEDSRTPLFAGIRKQFLKIPLPPPWSRLADNKEGLGRAYIIRPKDKVRNSQVKIRLEQPVHQMKAEISSFRTLVRLDSSLRQALGLNHRVKWYIVSEVPTTVLRVLYFTK